jgi:autotransporter-associated beta strand protein
MKFRITLRSLVFLLFLPAARAAPVFSWEAGTEGWLPSAGNPAVTGDETTITPGPTGATEGTQALAISTPMGVTDGWHGMWYATPTEINLDQPTRQALFTGATEILLDVSYPNPGYTSWWGTPTVELIIQGDGVSWSPLGSRDVTVDGAPQTVSWPLSVAQAASLANGTWAQMILKFTYGNGGSSTPNAVFYVDNFRSTVVIVPPPEVSHFWKGDVSASWTDLNWTEDAEGSIPTPALPADGTAAIAFAAVGATNLSTILGADQNVLSMAIKEASGPVDIGGAHNLTLGEDGILIEANGGPVTINTTGQVILAADQLWTNNSSSLLTVESAISGNFKLTTGGSGTTFLLAANTHTGGTAVQQGTLVIGDPLSLGPVDTRISVTGGMIDLNGLSPTVGGISGSLGGVITSLVSEPVTLTIDDDSGSTFDGVINDSPSGIVSVVKRGTGSLALGGAGSFSGNFLIEEGTVTANTAVFGAPNATNFGNAQVPERTITVASAASVLFNINNVLGNQQANVSNLPTFVLNGSTLDATRYNLIGNLVMNGGTLSHTSTDGGPYQGYQFKGQIEVIGTQPSQITSSNGKGNHLSDDTVFNIAAPAGSLIISAPLVNQSGDFGSVSGGLSKTGPGTLLLDGLNTYSGPTRIMEGTLSLGTSSLSNVAAVELSPGAVLDLAFAGLDLVGEFIVDGVSQGSGTYGAVGSGADHEWAQITGIGLLEVAPDPFPDWIGGYPELLGINAAKTADPDKDGLTNLEEFALDGDPTAGVDTGKVRSRVETIGVDQALVVTLPVRDDAMLSGTAPVFLTAQGCVYVIGGSNGLAVFDQAISEVLPALTANPALPELSQGWSYRSFRLNGSVGGGNPRGPRGFLRVTIEE